MQITFAQGHLFLEHYGLADGLNASTIWKVLKDDQGFLWLATDDGLVRYDGLEFKVFRNDIEDTTGFEHRNVFDLVKDHYGNLLAVAKNSLVRLDPHNLQIKRIPHCDKNFRTDIPNVPRILALGIDPANNTWVCTSYGIFVLGKDDLVLRYIRIEDETEEFKFNTCRGIVFDERGYAWVTTAAGMVRIHTADYSFQKWKTEELDRGVFYAEGKVWAYGQKLYCFDTNNPQPEIIPQTEVGGFVFSITENPRRKGELWLANRSGGVEMFDTREKKFRSYQLHREVKSDYPLYATHVYFDEEALWIATHNGLYRTVLTDDQIHTVVLSDATGIPDLSLFNLFPDNQSDTKDWCLVNTSDGLFRWNFKTGEYVRMPYPKTAEGNEITGLNFRFQNELHDDFWSVGFQGLYRCRNNICKLILADSTVESVNRDWRWFISNVRRDRYGRFWIAAETKLALLEDEEITFFTPPPILDQHGDTLMAKPSFNQFLFDKNENIWIISDFSMQKHVIAVYRFDVNTKQFEAFYHQKHKDFPNVENIFNHALIGEEIWCATASGIIRFNPYQPTPSFDLITYKDWLPTSGCGSVAAGSRGEAWVTTKAGLIRWRSDDNVRIFKRTDGFFEDNPGIMRRGEDGTVYLHSDHYVTWFHPDSLRSSRKVLQPYLTNIYVNSKPYLSDFAPSFLSELHLSHVENTLALSFSALDFAKTKNVLYAYKLEGSDEDWIETSSNSVITLSNLNGGDYVFRVKARYSDEDWSERTLSLQIHIGTAWYRSWWFFSLIALAVGTIIYFLSRFRLNQLLRLHKVRNRIASDLHDDVGSSLSSLVLYSDLLARKDLSEEKQQEIASKIRETAYDSMESMRDIVWSIKSTNDDFEVTTRYMQRVALDLVESAGIQFTMETDPALHNLKLPMELRKNLFLIFKEAINNARKYSDATEIRASLKRTTTGLSMEVADNGRGFDLSNIQQHIRSGGGNGIANMQKRTAELRAELIIDAKPGKGTRIALHIPF